MLAHHGASLVHVPNSGFVITDALTHVNLSAGVQRAWTLELVRLGARIDDVCYTKVSRTKKPSILQELGTEFSCTKLWQ